MLLEQSPVSNKALGIKTRDEKIIDNLKEITELAYKGQHHNVDSIPHLKAIEKIALDVIYILKS